MIQNMYHYYYVAITAATTDTTITASIGLPKQFSGKESLCQCKRHSRCGFDPRFGNIPWMEEEMHSTPVFLPGESCGRRSLVGYSPSCCKKSQTTEHTCTARIIDVFLLKIPVSSQFGGKIRPSNTFNKYQVI